MVTSGIVKSVSGTVTAIAEDGTERILQVGDMVLPDEQIVTGVAGTISVDFEDGRHMDMGRDSRLTLNDEELGIDLEANVEEGMAEALGDVAAMQAALENGGDFDPNNMEATAAGAGTSGNEGSTTVDVAFLGGEVTPDSGFDTIGIDRGVALDTIRPPLTTVVNFTVSDANGAVGVSATSIDEDVNEVTFTVSLSTAGESDVTVATTFGDIIIPAGQVTGALDVPLDNSDVYVDPEVLTGEILSVTGGGFDVIEYGNKTVEVTITDTIDTTVVSLSSPDINEDGTNATVTVSLSNPGETAVTVTTNLGSVVIPAGETSGTIDVPLDNSDVYTDPDTLAVEVTAVDGGNFEAVDFSESGTIVNIVDVDDALSIKLETSDINENQDTVTFTATLSQAADGDVTVTTTLGDITIKNGETTGILEVTGNENRDVYEDSQSVSNAITGATGPLGAVFEDLTITSGTVTANVVDVDDALSIKLETSDINENQDTVTFTATLSQAADGDVTVTTTLGDITIKNGETTGILEVTGNENRDVYEDSQSVSNAITGATGPLGAVFEDLTITSGTVTANVVDVDDLVVVSIVSDGDVNEGGDASFTISVSPELEDDLVVTLVDAGGNFITTVTIPATQSSVNYTTSSQDETSITVGISTAIVAGETFEDLSIGSDAIVSVNYLPIDESYTLPLVLNNVAGSVVVDDLFDANLDGFGNVTISKNFDLNLKSGGEDLVYSNDVDGNLIAKTETSGTTVFTVTQIVSGNDVDYVFNLSASLELQTMTTHNAGDPSEGGNQAYYWLLDDGTLESGGTVAEQPSNSVVAIRGRLDDGTYANVNGNNNGLGSTGIGGQTIEDGEWVQLAYLTAQTSVEVGIGQGSSNAVPDDATTIEIKINGGAILTFHGSDLENGKLIINASDYPLVTSISTVEVSATTTNLVINSISTSSTTNVDDEILEFTYVGEDTDGDSTSGEFSVLIKAGESLSSLDSTGELIRGTDAVDSPLDGTADGDMIYGYGGNDTINGGEGNDVLIGGLGSDNLTGGVGADEFEWNAGETGTDIVTDFTLDVPASGNTPIIEGDVLNLSDLLTGEESLDHTDNSTLASDLTNYLTITSDGTDTTIVADHDGSGIGTVEQTITLSNVDLLNGGTAADAIQNLLDNGNLIVD